MKKHEFISVWGFTVNGTMVKWAVRYRNESHQYEKLDDIILSLLKAGF